MVYILVLHLLDLPALSTLDTPNVASDVSILRPRSLQSTPSIGNIQYRCHLECTDCVILLSEHLGLPGSVADIKVRIHLYLVVTIRSPDPNTQLTTQATNDVIVYQPATSMMARNRAVITFASIERYAEETFPDAYQNLSVFQYIGIESLDIGECHGSSRSRRPVREGSATTRLFLGYAEDINRTGVYVYMHISER